MTIICTAEEKETIINVIQTGNTCFHDWKCIPSCRECIEKNIDFITDDDVEVCKKGDKKNGHND